VRRAGYSVTGGDALALQTTGLVGALASMALVSDDASSDTRWGAAAGGLVGGLVLGDRFLVKPFDYTRSEARLLTTGAVAGGLLGLAVTSDGDGRSATVGATVGATLGMAVTHHFAKPRSVRRGDVMRSALRSDVASPGEPGGRATGLAWQFDPTALALAATRQPGRHSVLSLTF
jgi:hypothetical protein